MKRWFRHRLRTIFLAIFLVACLLAWLANNRRVYNYEQSLIQQAEGVVGPIFLVDSEHPPAPPFGFITETRPLVVRDETWLSTRVPNLLRPVIFERVSSIHMFDCEADDRLLDVAAQFARLKYIQIPESGISDQALDRFRRAHPEVEIVVGMFGEE